MKSKRPTQRWGNHSDKLHYNKCRYNEELLQLEIAIVQIQNTDRITNTTTDQQTRRAAGTLKAKAQLELIIQGRR